MSKAPIQKNPKKARHGANVNRPNGCSSLATGASREELLSAALTGNRATRREARRNIIKTVKKWAKTPEGIAANAARLEAKEMKRGGL